jgi:hypothetical protein
MVQIDSGVGVLHQLGLALGERVGGRRGAGVAPTHQRIGASCALSNAGTLAEMR